MPLRRGRQVFFLAILTSVFNFSVFQYLHNARAPAMACYGCRSLPCLEANVAYLNLSLPESDEIVCKLPRVLEF